MQHYFGVAAPKYPWSTCVNFLEVPSKAFLFFSFLAYEIELHPHQSTFLEGWAVVSPQLAKLHLLVLTGSHSHSHSLLLSVAFLQGGGQGVQVMCTEAVSQLADFDNSEEEEVAGFYLVQFQNNRRVIVQSHFLPNSLSTH